MTFRKHLSALATLAAMVSFTTAAEATTVTAQKGNMCSATWNTGQAAADAQSQPEEALDAHLHRRRPGVRRRRPRRPVQYPRFRMRASSKASCAPRSSSASSS